MSLIARYKLNGNVQDALDNYNPTYSNVDTWEEGQYGNAAKFNLGANNSITGPGWNIKDKFSYFFKAKRLGDSGDIIGGLVGNLWHGGALTGLCINFISSSTSVRIESGDGTILSSYNVTLPVVNTDWCTYIVTYDGVKVDVYQNGTLIDSRLRVVAADPTRRDWSIGRWAASYNAYWLNGLISDVRIYDHALSKKEIADLSLGLFSYYKLENNNLDSQLNSPITLVNGTFIDTPIGRVADIRSGYARIELANTKKELTNRAITFKAKCEVLRNTVPAGSFVYRILQWGGYYTNNSGGIGYFSGVASYYLKASTGAGWTSQGTLNAAHSLFDTLDWLDYAIVFESPTRLKVYVNTLLLADITLPIPYTNLDNTGIVFGENMKMMLKDVKEYYTALTENQINYLYKNKGSLDDKGNLYSVRLRNTGIRQKLNLNYTTWQADQTGSIGDFSVNGDISENFRVLANDPWNKETVVWEARPTGVSGPDGGWNSTQRAVDKTKMYRFSTWVRRTVIGNGSFYLGCHATPNVLNRSNLASNSNAYFTSFGWTVPINTWILVIGYIWPDGSGVGAVHPSSGVYLTDGTKIGSCIDFVFAPATTTASLRSYLFYCTDSTTRQQWCYPRMDMCDGTEPTLAELFAGFDSLNEDIFRKYNGELPSLSVANDLVTTVNEVGITNGLVAYYPLTKDAKDYSGNEYHGTVTGAVPVAGGFDGKGAFRFSSSTTYIVIPSNLGYTKEVTVISWFRALGTPGSGYHVIVGPDSSEISVTAAGQLRTGVVTSARQVDNYAAGITDGNWHMLGFTAGLGEKKSYLNGSLVGTTTLLSDIKSSVTNRRIGVFGSSTNYYANGDICGVKVFNRILTPEEIAIEYKRMGKTKMSQHKGITYIQGEVKELTS